jgi:hypothetical protein
MVISRFLQREPKEQWRIQMCSRKDDYGRRKYEGKIPGQKQLRKQKRQLRQENFFKHRTSGQKAWTRQHRHDGWQDKKIQNSGDLKTLRICIVYGTRKETTQQEIDESSLISMQEKEKIRIKKRITRRKTKTTQEKKVSNNRREQLR